MSANNQTVNVRLVVPLPTHRAVCGLAGLLGLTRRKTYTALLHVTTRGEDLPRLADYLRQELGEELTPDPNQNGGSDQ